MAMLCRYYANTIISCAVHAKIPSLSRSDHPNDCHLVAFWYRHLNAASPAVKTDTQSTARTGRHPPLANWKLMALGSLLPLFSHGVVRH
jgi:hypothetical protein